MGAIAVISRVVFWTAFCTVDNDAGQRDQDAGRHSSLRLSSTRWLTATWRWRNQGHWLRWTDMWTSTAPRKYSRDCIYEHGETRQPAFRRWCRWNYQQNSILWEECLKNLAALSYCRLWRTRRLQDRTDFIGTNWSRVFQNVLDLVTCKEY